MECRHVGDYTLAICPVEEVGKLLVAIAQRQPGAPYCALRGQAWAAKRMKRGSGIRVVHEQQLEEMVARLRARLEEA